MYDDAEWLRFGIDPQQRAAFQKFAAEKSVQLKRRHALDEADREDCEMQMIAALLFSCLERPDKSDNYRFGVMRNAARKFMRRHNDHERMFTDLSAAQSE